MYTILNLYCPTNLQERIEFINENIAWVKRYKIDGKNLIVGGDMNCVDWPSDRKSFVTDKSSETLRKFKNSLNVTDMWKYMIPDTNDFTYIDPSFRHMNSRIDILCVCEQVKPCVESCDHVITPCPDHKAVLLCVRGDKRPTGRGYWKLNDYNHEDVQNVNNICAARRRQDMSLQHCVFLYDICV